ncbi:MAG: hypothetical protein IPM53_30315 [Anaerolineaceae bacterium]|nr:hypothetical protein [Anaerolineaceae bacterium]
MRTVFVVCLVLLLAAACGAETPEEDTAVTPLSERDMTVSALTTAIAASAEPPFDPTALRGNLETAVALWNDQAVASYQVTINHRQPTWDTQYITITVEDGAVTDTSQTCYPAQNCVLRDVDPQTLTIEALFQTAEFVLGLNDPETEMTFNKTYGYPNAVIYEDASWVVNDFKPLENE